MVRRPDTESTWPVMKAAPSLRSIGDRCWIARPLSR